MNPPLSPELSWLTLTLAITALFCIPIVINRIAETGLWAALNTPKRGAEAAWAERLIRAHGNAIENIAVFAPLVLMVQFCHLNSPATVMACMLYFFARLGHVLAYTAGIPVLRTLAFVVGFLCQMELVAILLQIF